MKRSFDVLDELSVKKVKYQPLPSLKRSSMDCIDFSNLKRMRILDDQQAAQLEPLLYRLVIWLIEQSDRNNLPKTYTKLMKTISPMCKTIIQVDPSVVFYHLLFNKVIIIEQLEEGRAIYQANPEPLHHSFIGIVPSDSPSSIPFSEDFIRALERSVGWILNNRGLHQFKTVDSLLKSMEQLCRFKREVNPVALVEMMRRKGYISNGTSMDEVCYSLPREVAFPSVEHYPPSYSQDMEVCNCLQ
jgi:hypothetical protein